MAGFQQPWAVTDMRSPPKQFSFTIPNGGIEKVFYNHNFLRILSISNTTGVTIRFGDSGTATDLIGAGVGYELNEIVGNSYIQNNSGAPITITVVAAIGRIYDDRLNVSGNINVVNAPGTVIDTSLAGTIFRTVEDVSVPATSQGAILPVLATRREALITNNGSIAVRVGDISTGAARGASIAPGATAVISTQAAIYVYNPAAVAVSIGISENIS